MSGNSLEHTRNIYSPVTARKPTKKRLNNYLEEFDRQVRGTLILTEEQLRQAEGITEELKRKDQLEWVRRMNNISSRAEEIVMAELVYE